MNDIRCYEEEGATITVCAPHGREYCPSCCFDFAEMNNDARRKARLLRAARPPQTRLGRGLLLSGTEVRMLDRSGRSPPEHLDGRITGTQVEDDEESDFHGDKCYVIQYRDSEVMNYPIEWLHDEWLVKKEGRYVPAHKYVQQLSRQSRRGR
ncbi:hypothetical protein R1flu_028859 [Riccia fluitans]|uniref:Uncharacterized protein n=1 Tax=Riccia fluitans TaxID=41844 RepID=A0ABD1XQW1_9MARC